VYSAGGSQLSMTDCILSNNYAGSYGGGIYLSYGPGFHATTAINGCTLSSNYGGKGSAIYNGSQANFLTISNSLFSNNSPTGQFPISGQWFDLGGNTFK
jgi:predicted outer membrane repeat protein